MATPLYRKEMVLEVDHFQFYFEDCSAGDHWPDTQTLSDMKSYGGITAIASDILSIATFRATGQARIQLTYYGVRPQINRDSYDRAVLCSLTIPSGKACLRAAETPQENIIVLPFLPGSYQLLIGSYGWDAANDEQALEGNEFYHLTIWPGEAIVPEVLHDRIAVA